MDRQTILIRLRAHESELKSLGIDDLALFDPGLRHCPLNGNSAAKVDDISCHPHNRDRTLEGFPRIAIDPTICGGRPTVAGTRVRVTDILEMLASGAGEAEIATDFPYVAAADVRACLAYAAQAVDHPVVIAAE